MTGLHKVFDAAFPPSSAPPWAQGACGYVWRKGYATNVWQPASWLPFAHLRQFPLAVPDLNNTPAAEAAGITAAVTALGWAPHLPEPNTRAIIIDGETSIFPAWYEETAGLIGEAGFVAVDYGSLNYVVANAASDLFVADWNDVAALQPGQTIHGDQYQAGIPWLDTQVDASVFDDWLFNRGGIGARHQKG